MKKSQLRQLVLEAMKGYSKYAPGGETEGGTTADFRNILTKIAKGEDKEPIKEEDSNLSASDIKEFVQNALNLRDYDVVVRFTPNYKEVKITRKQDPSEEDFNTIIKYLEDNGYTVNQEQSRRKGEDEEDNYNYPRIIFT